MLNGNETLRFNEKLLNLSIKHENSSVFQHHTVGSQISKTLPCRLVGRGDRGSLSIRLGQVDHWILCSQESQFLRSCALIIWENLQGIGEGQTQQNRTWEVRK